MPVSEAQKRASLKYRKAKLSRIEFTVQKEYKEEIEQHAQKHEETVSDFIKRAIAEAMERDKEKFRPE